ncbi:hypothetical protein ACFW1M_09115 [Streptomyces inhibens]|uniref:hypothetical protein n=1 Tax=Streptomyces inhibens TaxID=2293571 RepID=UPI0036B888FD
MPAAPRPQEGGAAIGSLSGRVRKRYTATAQPFQGKFTTSDLDDLLARLDQHTPDHAGESFAAKAA